MVNIVIIEGKNLSDKDGELLSKPHLRLRFSLFLKFLFFFVLFLNLHQPFFKDTISSLLFVVEIRLGNEKYKTKTATRITSSSTVTWLEQFDFHLFEDQPNIASHLLEINLFEKTSLGREDSVAR